MADMYLGNESGGFDLVGTTNIKNIDFEEAKISKEDYENLSEEEQKTGVHLVTGLDDTENGGGSADLISYDNTNSGLDSTNVQGAIDELNSNFEKLHKPITLETSQSITFQVHQDVTFDLTQYNFTDVPIVTLRSMWLCTAHIMSLTPTSMTIRMTALYEGTQICYVSFNLFENKPNQNIY